MINLLSPLQKKNYRAARRNTIWRHYTLLLGASFLVLNIILGLTAWYINNEEITQKAIKEENVNSQTQEYKDNKRNIENFRNKLDTAKILLNEGISYSDVAISIAGSIPPECRLGSLTLNNQFFDTPQSLAFKCRNQGDVVTLKSALENKPTMFDKVSILSSNGSEGSSNEYTIDAVISTIVKKPVQKSTEVNP